MRPSPVPRSARPRFPTTPLRVLHVTMELAPWSVVGDVGEFVAGLAAAQSAAGDRVTVVTPLHADGDWPLSGMRQVVGSGAVLRLADREFPFALRRLQHPDGFEAVLVESDLFERAGVYSHPDTGEIHPDTLLRSSVLCHAALYYALNAGGRWQVIHGHDHHGAMAVALLQRRFQPTPLQHARSVLTVHDPSRLGLHPPEETALAGLPEAEGRPGGSFAYQGALSMLRAGLRTADAVHCVAASHRELLLTDGNQGHPLAEDARGRPIETVPGGVDPNVWDPADDPALAASYSDEDLEPRASCREDLLGLCSWPEDGSVILGYAGPVFPERGLVELAEALATLPDLKARLVVAGPGDGETLDRLRCVDDPRVLVLGPDSATRRQILAGVDIYALPGADCAGDLTHGPALRYGACVLHREGAAPDGLNPECAVPIGEEEPLADALLRVASSRPEEAAVRAALASNRPWHESAREVRRRFYLEPAK
jgi:starch synthase